MRKKREFAMKFMSIRVVIILFLILLAPAFFEGCNSHMGDQHSQSLEQTTPGVNDMDLIREKGKLVVVADYNSTSYFIYRGQPMGFQYQMLQELANYLDLRLEVKVSSDLESSFESLNKGEIDLIAMNLAITAERKERVAFTYPHSQTRQVLIQKKPDNYMRLNSRQVEDSLVRNQLDLAGKTVYVQRGSVYVDRLRSLSNEIGEDILIEEVPVEAEQLIQMVAKGEIDFTVADENVANVNQSYFPQLDTKTAVSFPQNLAWAVRKDSKGLKNEIDTWMQEFKHTTRYAVIYNKYFENQHSVSRVNSDYYVLGSGKISRYDESVKKESQRIGWDWRLVSSMIYQESRFNPEAKSWAGAYGLMQLMPVTAKRFGVNKNSSPEAQIKAGVSLIGVLDNRYKNDIPDTEERCKFVLAAYNVGKGHVDDARRLARKFGDDPNIWDENVEKWLLKKSDPEYYKDPVVKYGYSRGVETYNYVKQVLDRFEHYKNIADDNLLASNQLVP